MANINKYITKLEEQAEKARQKNEERYAEAMKKYKDIEAMYAPGGTFGAGYEAQLETQKKRDVASEVSQSVSSGLFGTTVPGTAAKRWEETVGTPARLKLEDLRTERYAEAMRGTAGLIERREDTYPDYGTIANLISQASQSQTSSYPVVRGYTVSGKGFQPYKGYEEAWAKLKAMKGEML